jgi:hypothetical protein
MATRTWLASFYDASGKRHRKTFATKDEAQKWESDGKAAAAQAKAARFKKAAQKAVINIEASAARG